MLLLSVAAMVKVDRVALRADPKAATPYMQTPRRMENKPARLWVNGKPTNIVVHDGFTVDLVGHDRHGRVAGNLSFDFSGAYTGSVGLGFVTTGTGAAIAFPPPPGFNSGVSAINK